MLGLPLRFVLLVAVGGLALPAVSVAADRYASPTGPLTAGAPCTLASPCGIGIAARDASPGDVIRLLPGDHGSLDAPLGYGIYSDADLVSYIGHPKARLVIANTDGDDSILLKNTQAWFGEGMQIVSFDVNALHTQGNVTLDAVNVVSRSTAAGATACYLEGSASTSGAMADVRDSVCLARGGGASPRGLAVQARRDGQSFTARHVSAVSADGSGGRGVWFANSTSIGAPGQSTLRLDLAIAEAIGPATLDYDSTVDTADHRACVVLRDTAVNSGATGQCAADELNPTREVPQFESISSDLHQRPSSPLIDVFTPPLAGLAPRPVDLDGLPRDTNDPDPGAYEYRPELATTGTVTDLTPTSATLVGTVRGSYGTSIVRFTYGRTVVYDTTTAAQFFAATAEPVGVTQAISGLQPDTEYHVRLTSTGQNEATVAGTDVTFRTPAVPAPVGPGTPGTAAPPVTTTPSGSTPTIVTTVKRCVVPRLKGLTLATARRRLTRAGCRLGTVRGTTRRGARVRAQTLRVGRRLRAGAKVGVRLAVPRKSGR